MTSEKLILKTKILKIISVEGRQYKSKGVILSLCLQKYSK